MRILGTDFGFAIMFFFLRVIGSGALPLGQDRRQPLSPDAEGMAKPPLETEWRSHPLQKRVTDAQRKDRGPCAIISGGSGRGLATQLCCTVQFRSEGIRRYLPKVLYYNFLVFLFFSQPPPCLIHVLIFYLFLVHVGCPVYSRELRYKCPVYSREPKF